MTTNRIKVQDLIGKTLDYAFSKCEGYTITSDDISTNWSIGGLIIDRENISIIRTDDDYGIDDKGFCDNIRIPVWCATIGQQSITGSTNHDQHEEMYQIYVDVVVYGSTPLIAALRCYVYSKLGYEIDIPIELLEV